MLWTSFPVPLVSIEMHYPLSHFCSNSGFHNLAHRALLTVSYTTPLSPSHALQKWRLNICIFHYISPPCSLGSSYNAALFHPSIHPSSISICICYIVYFCIILSVPLCIFIQAYPIHTPIPFCLSRVPFVSHPLSCHTDIHDLSYLYKTQDVQIVRKCALFVFPRLA